MLKKLHLDLTRDYEIAIATQEIVLMLVAFIDGRPGNRAIGSEQGGIEKWDDLVIEKADYSFEHVQVKRNNSDFSDGFVERGVKKSGPNKGDPSKLSPLDESLASLGSWSRTNDLSKCQPQRRFCIEVPDGMVQIKSGLTIHHLYEACHDLIKPETDLAKFLALIAGKTSISDIAIWLRTWCDFDDDAHILTVLKNLEIRKSGNTVDILREVTNTLAHYFTDAAAVTGDIKLYITDNMTFSTALTSRGVLSKVIPLLRPEVARWTQYQYDQTSNSYKIDGIHDSRIGRIEEPDAVVGHLWNRARTGFLRLDAPVKMQQTLSQSIVRLAVHLGPSQAFFKSNEGWKQSAKEAVGGTLGLSKDDLDTVSMWECPGIQLGSDFKTLGLTSDHENEADSLNEQMQSKVWEEVVVKVYDAIAGAGVPLRNVIETRWNAWKLLLDGDLSAQTVLCNEMLQPAAEIGITAHLRVGLKTTGLIAEGIFMLLVVTVCLGGSDSSLSYIDDKSTAIVRANRIWAGPLRSATALPRRLVESDKDKLLAAEGCQVLVLSGVEESPTDYKDVGLADENVPSDSLARPRVPQIVVTACGKFFDLVRKGNLDLIKSYLTKQLNETR